MKYDSRHRSSCSQIIPFRLLHVVCCVTGNNELSRLLYLVLLSQLSWAGWSYFCSPNINLYSPQSDWQEKARRRTMRWDSTIFNACNTLWGVCYCPRGCYIDLCMPVFGTDAIISINILNVNRQSMRHLVSSRLLPNVLPHLQLAAWVTASTQM